MTQSLTTVVNLKCNVMPSGCRNQLSQMLMKSRYWFNKSMSGPRMLMLELGNGQQKLWGFGRRRVAWQCNGKITKLGSATGRLPSAWASASSKESTPSKGISSLIVALLESVIWYLKGRYGHGTWQPSLTWMARNSSLHWLCCLRLSFAKGRIWSMKPSPIWQNSSTVVCIPSPRCFFCSSWGCVFIEDNKELTSGHRSSPIKPCSDALTEFVVDPFCFNIAYGDCDIAGKKDGENNTLLFSWHWPGDDESIIPIVTSIVDTSIVSNVNAAIASLPDTIWNIRELCGCREEPNRYCGPHACNVTPFLSYNTAAGWVKGVMKFNNPMLFCVVYGGQQAEGTSGAQTAVHGGRSNLPLDDILPPPAEHMIYNMVQESDDDAEMCHPNPRSFPTTKIGFQKFECMPHMRIIRQQWYLEVIRNPVVGLFADHERSVVADEDVAWLLKHVHIVNPPAAGTMADWKCTSSRPAAN